MSCLAKLRACLPQVTYEIGGNLASGKWQVATFFVPPNITRKGVVGGGRRLHTTVTGVGIAFSAMLGVVARRRGVGITLSAMLGVAASRRGWASLLALCRHGQLKRLM